jgi:hypothetical protein
MAALTAAVAVAPAASCDSGAPVAAPAARADDRGAGLQPVAPTDAPDVVGRYALHALDGSPLPAYLLRLDTWADEVLEGALELRGDGSCVETSRWRRTRGPRRFEESVRVACVYRASASTIVFQFATSPSRLTGVTAGRERDGFVMRDAGAFYEFRRVGDTL